MYRQYEDPRALEKQLEEARSRECEIRIEVEAEGEDSWKWEALVDIGLEIASLEERVNFAWQDEEYDEMVCGPQW